MDATSNSNITRIRITTPGDGGINSTITASGSVVFVPEIVNYGTTTIFPSTSRGSTSSVNRTDTTPLKCCKRLWREFVSFPTNSQSLVWEVTKRILIFIPLLFATLGAALIHPFIKSSQSTTITSSTSAPGVRPVVVTTHQQVEIRNGQMSFVAFSS